MTINELYSRMNKKRPNNEKEQNIEAFELDNINNNVLMERLEKIERKIFENKFISERFKSIAKEGNFINPKQISEIVNAMQAQTKGLNYIEVVQKLTN